MLNMTTVLLPALIVNNIYVMSVITHVRCGLGNIHFL